MSFPSSDGTRVPLGTALTQAVRIASHLRTTAESLRSAIAAGSVERRRVADLCDDYAAQDARLGIVAAQSGIVAYARGEFDDPALDLAAEFTAMRAALQAVITDIRTTFPRSASGALEERELDGSGRKVYRVFTGAQLAALDGLLATLIGAIDAPA